MFFFFSFDFSHLFDKSIIFYINMAIKSSQTLVQEALNKIKTISPEEALKLSNNNKCNLIDIRDIRELENDGRI